MLTREKLLFFRLPVLEVAIPELEDIAFIRSMDCNDRDFVSSYVAANRESTLPDFREMTLVRALCDAEGTRLFSDADVPELKKMPAFIIDKLYKVASDYNSLGEEAKCSEQNTFPERS